MSTENLVLEYLRAIRTKIDKLADDMVEVKGRLGMLEQQYANISNRLDRMDDRVHRIEKRLELIEA